MQEPPRHLRTNPATRNSLVSVCKHVSLSAGFTCMKHRDTCLGSLGRRRNARKKASGQRFSGEERRVASSTIAGTWLHPANNEPSVFIGVKLSRHSNLPSCWVSITVTHRDNSRFPEVAVRAPFCYLLQASIWQALYLFCVSIWPSLEELGVGPARKQSKMKTAQ